MSFQFSRESILPGIFPDFFDARSILLTLKRFCPDYV